MTWPVKGNFGTWGDFTSLGPPLTAGITALPSNRRDPCLPPRTFTSSYNLLIVGVTQSEEQPTWHFGGKFQAAYVFDSTSTSSIERIAVWDTWHLYLYRYHLIYVPPIDGVQIKYTYYPPRWFWNYSLSVQRYNQPYFYADAEKLEQMYARVMYNLQEPPP